MRHIFNLLICLIVLHKSTVATEFDQTCDIMSTEKELECGMYAHRIIKPMMAYFRQVNEILDKTNPEMEKKNAQIDKLEEKVSQYQQEIASCTSKDNIIQIHKEKDESNADLINSLKQQIDLTKTIDKQHMEITQLKAENNAWAKKQLENDLETKNQQIRQLEEKVSRLEKQNEKSMDDTIAAVIEELKKQKKIIYEFANKTCETQNKLITENELKNIENQKEKIIADREKTIHRLETEIETMKHQIISLNISKEQQNKDIVNLNAKIKTEAQKVTQCKAEIQKKKSRSCVTLNLPGVHNITLRNNHTFEVLCSSYIAGSGCTVIQQRINGGVDFYRDWVTYRNGFGAFWDGDFFLGLEKIYSLTSDQPHELYIHMQNYDGRTFYARYNEFAISGVDDQYRLSSLGRYSGSAGDELSAHKNRKFSTYEHDNDDTPLNCAKTWHGGWWYGHCGTCNLNGRYYSVKVESKESNFWGLNNSVSLKVVRMMIRPKTD